MEIFSNISVRSKILSYIYILDSVILHNFFEATVSCEYKYDMLSKNEKDCFEKVIKYYKETNNNNNIPNFPFDVFGTDVFREQFLPKQNQTLKNNFIEYLKKNLFVYVKDYSDFKRKVAFISLLRHYFEHIHDPKKKTITINNIEYELDIEDSLKNLFLFLPNIYTNDIKLLLEREKSFGKFDYDIDKLFQNILKTKAQNVSKVFEKYYDKSKIDNIIENKILIKSLQSIKLSNKLERMHFINNYNFAKINIIIKTIYGKTLYNKKRDKFYLEEKEKIFMLFIKINEILQKHFVYNFETIKNKITDEKIIKIRNQISHGRIFFYNEGNAKISYFDTFKENISLILDFFDKYFDNAKELKINLLKSLRSVFTKKDNMFFIINLEKQKDKDKAKKEILSIKIANDKNQTVHKRYKDKIKMLISNIEENPNKKFMKDKSYIFQFSLYKDLKIKLKEVIEEAKNNNYCKIKNK